MKLSFSTLACPDWSWSDIIAHGTRFGYDGVEVRLLERETDLLQRPELRPQNLATRRRELAESGFRIAGLASSVRFDDPGLDQRKQQLEIGRAYLELAAELGADFVRVFGDVLPEDNATRAAETIQNIAEGLQALGEYAEPLGLVVVLETHGDFSDSRLCRETLQRVESPAVGLLWDTHHPWRFAGEALAETFERLKPWVQHDTHWKDSISGPRRMGGDEATQAAAEAHALMSGHRHADYVLFGGGEFPVDECLRLLLEAGYDGWFCYEWEKAWHPEIEDPEIALPLFPEKIRRYADLVS